MFSPTGEGIAHSTELGPCSGLGFKNELRVFIFWGHGFKRQERNESGLTALGVEDSEIRPLCGYI